MEGQDALRAVAGRKRRRRRLLWAAAAALLALPAAALLWPKPDPLRDMALLRGLAPSSYDAPGPLDWSQESYTFVLPHRPEEVASGFFADAERLGFTPEEVGTSKAYFNSFGNTLLTKRVLGVLQWQIYLGPEGMAHSSLGGEIPSDLAVVTVYKPRPDTWLLHVFDKP